MAPRAGDEEMRRAAEGTPEPLYRCVLALMGDLARSKLWPRRVFVVALATLMTPRPLRATTDRPSSPKPRRF